MADEFAYKATVPAAQSSAGNGFLDFLGKVGDAAVDLGKDYGKAAINKEMAADTEESYTYVDGVGLVKDGTSQPVKVTEPGSSSNLTIFGVPVNKTALAVGGAALALVVVAKLLR